MHNVRFVLLLIPILHHEVHASPRDVSGLIFSFLFSHLEKGVLRQNDNQSDSHDHTEYYPYYQTAFGLDRGQLALERGGVVIIAFLAVGAVERSVAGQAV
jgi:hypothetical protein